MAGILQSRPRSFLVAAIPMPRRGPGLIEMSQTKKLHIKTYGCQMNVYDSERMLDALRSGGFETTENSADADLILLNTCHIREKASEKVYSELGRLAVQKRAGQDAGRTPRIVVAGCVAQAEGSEIMRRAPQVDLVIGPQSYHRLPELLARNASDSQPRRDTDFPEESKFDALPVRRANGVAAAFVTVQEGCDKFCTFCVVPYTRGTEVSRPVAAIVHECEQLAEGGVRELTLLGQNVNAYHGPGPDGAAWSLAQLLDRLSEIDGIERLRYTTSHPRDMRDDLMHQHRDNPKVMPYLHLPIQSGSDRILDAMNRKHTVHDYLALIERMRDARPDIALSTDIIVGFPGETEHDFRATIDLVHTIGFAQAYSFKYSHRPGTPAATMDGQVSAAEKSTRLAELQCVLTAQQTGFNAATVGRRLPVLFESSGRNGRMIGRSQYMQVVRVPGPQDLIGKIHDVQIASAGPGSLDGSLVEPN